MKKVLLSGVAILLAAPAVAADLPTKKAPELPVITEYDWTGFYFGGNLGGVWGHDSYNDYSTVTGLWTDGGSQNVSSFIGGGQAGYRYMFPQRFVIGAEASLDWFSGSSHQQAAYNLRTGALSSEWSTYSSGWGGNVVGVAGYAWGDFLPFIKGGWAWSQANVTHYQLYGTTGGLFAPPGAVAAGQPYSEVASLSRGGWTIGGGLAYHFWSNWEVFGQYMYANYGTGHVNYIALQRSTRTSLDTNALTFGVNLKL